MLPAGLSSHQTPCVPFHRVAQAHCHCCRTRQAVAAGQEPDRRFSDGIRKWTMEDVWGSGSEHRAHQQALPVPWQTSWQVNERNVWNDNLKEELIKRIAADRSGIDSAELEARLAEVVSLLPDLAPRLKTMSPDVVARLAAKADDLAERLLQLKAALPGANAASLIGKMPSVVLSKQLLMQLPALVQELRDLLPGAAVDRLVSDWPELLNVPALKRAMQTAKQVMPDLDPVLAIRRDPSTILQFQREGDLVAYDSPYTSQD